MSLYHFKRLIRKYSSTFTLEVYPPSKYVGGDPVVGEPERKKLSGAVLPVSSRKIYQSGGNITARDRQLYRTERLPPESKVVYKGQRYSVEEESDYTDFADVAVYLLKWEGECAESDGNRGNETSPVGGTGL